MCHFIFYKNKSASARLARYGGEGSLTTALALELDVARPTRVQIRAKFYTFLL